MKVVFCVHDSPHKHAGGPYSWVRRLLPSLQQRGIKVKAFVFVSHGNPDDCPTLQGLKLAGIECVVMHWEEVRYTEDRIRWILQELNKDLPDVFVPNLSVCGFYASRWVKAAGIPTIGVLHSDDFFHHTVIDEFVNGSEAYRFSAIVCVSKLLESLVEKNAHQLVITRLPYGTPIPDGRASRSEVLNLIYVGRLVEEQKRISEVTQALCKATAQISGTKGFIYGDGAARKRVETIIEASSEASVQLVGAVNSDHMQQEMLKSQVFVLLSDYEGLPIALMEAMACGLVPVCTDMRSGIHELITAEENGLIVSDREEAFTHAINRLKNEAGLWEKLSAKARLTVEREFSHEVCTDQWETFLKNMAAEKPKRYQINIPRNMQLPLLKQGFKREDVRLPGMGERIKSIVSRIVSKYRLRKVMPFI